jgi:ABC-type phosphate/phosphonate transport system substrate-binding protein
MISSETRQQQQRLGRVLVTCALAAVLAGPPAGGKGQQAKADILRIGTSGSINSEKGVKENAALETLKAFIKEETGLNNEILRLKDWRQLADRMAKRELHLGVFQGQEFAWAQQQHPELKPLALAVNVYPFPVAYVVVKTDNPAKDFAGLKGQSVAIAANGPGFLRLFLERQSAVGGKKLEAFLGKIVTPENVEEALDDVVDGKVQAAAADRAALEAYKRRKPGRFKQLKPVAHSEPFLPPLVAYYDSVLDPETLGRFRQGLLDANRKERGQTMLTLFGLTRFDPVPGDFGKVVAAVRKAYPPPGAAGQ